MMLPFKQKQGFNETQRENLVTQFVFCISVNFVSLRELCISQRTLYFRQYPFCISVCFPLSTSTQHFLLIGLSVPADSLMLPLFAARTHTTIIENNSKWNKKGTENVIYFQIYGQNGETRKIGSKYVSNNHGTGPA